jgi:sulfite exporter TauE/SafE
MIWTAIILGFAGSLHCLGMCSPLAMSVSRISSNAVASRFIYNVGRIFMYGVLGSIVASVGLRFPVIKYQNLVSIILGIALLVIGISGVTLVKVPLISNALGKFSLLLKKLFSKFLQRKNYFSTFMLGSLNGILPCGLSFLALTYCLTLSGPSSGFVFMSAFGLGTLPVMLGFTSIFSWAFKKFNVRIQPLTTGVLILSGLLLIGRVFFIHLPHASSLQQGVVDIVMCR